jgi:microcystin-dependent protein
VAYELYPAVDGGYNFPPEIRGALSSSIELRNQVVPMAQNVRDNLTAAELWEGRVILNTTSSRINRYTRNGNTWHVVAEMQDAIPTGAIMPFASHIVPPGWHLCDGSIHGSLVLQTVTGMPTTPDLRGMFIVGAGDSYKNHDKGGLDAVRLSSEESGLPGHLHDGETTGMDRNQNHTHRVVVGPQDTDHNHTGQTAADSPDHTHHVALGGGGHGHNSAYGNNWQGSPQSQNPTGNDYGPIGWHRDNIHGVFTPGDHNHAGSSQGASARHSHPFSTSGSSVSHAHPTTVDATSVDHKHTFSTALAVSVSAAMAHENRPPYYALTYIIKKV